MKRWTLGLSQMIALTACNQTFGLGELTRTDSWEQAPTDQTDILFVIDNSDSMIQEQKLLADNFASFTNELEASNSDFQIGVVSTDMEATNAKRATLLCDPPILTPDTNYAGIFPSCAQIGVGGSGRERGLEAAWTAVSPQMTLGGPNDGFIRADANLLMIVLSDEDDCSDEGSLGSNASYDACYQKYDQLVPVGDFVQRWSDLKGGLGTVTFAGIVGPEDPDELCAQNSIPGRRYIEAAELTNGISASICESDWSSMLSDLGVAAVGIYTSFPMSCGAKDGTLKVEVDGAVIAEDPVNGYTYDAEGPSITFHGDAIPARGAAVSAVYTVEPGTCRSSST